MSIFSLRASALLLLLAAVFLPVTAHAADLYAQPPFTKAELTKFIDDLPRFRDWLRANKETAHPDLMPDDKPGFVYSAKAAAHAESLGWQAERFFCVMGRAAAAVAWIERGPAVKTAPPRDMPKVAPEEMEAVQENLTDLLRAASGK